jgi:uncharacterized protein (TIGR03435 family)
MSATPLRAGLGVRTIALIGLPVLQSMAQPPTKFDVISIKPVNSTRNGSPTNIEHGSLMASNISIRRLIELAFNVRDYQIMSAPGWIDGKRYDIVAKADSARDMTENEMRPLIQNLLKDRFRFRYLRDTRDLSGYSLVVANGGPKLKASDGDSASRTNITSYNSGKVSVEASKMSLANLALALDRLLKEPVMDNSGLSGDYDFKLEYDSGLDVEPTAASLFTALQEQLGVRLQARKVPVEMIVIENVEGPSGN